MLFRFTTVCGLVPLYALVTVCGRRERPCGRCRTHPQSLEPPALGTNANMAASPRHQGRFLGQSVGEGLWESSATAQLAVAEADGGGSRPTLLQGQRSGPHCRGRPPAPSMQSILAQDDPLELAQHLLARRLLGAHTREEKEQVGEGDKRGRERERPQNSLSD